MMDERWDGARPAGRAPERDDLWPPSDARDSDGAETEARSGADAPRPGRMERATGALGAATAVALVVGLGAWTWDLARRDLSEVPVVRALQAPARVAPDEPGGEVAEHQGFAVNAIQAARDEAKAEPERVVLAPRSEELAADDHAPAADEAGGLPADAKLAAVPADAEPEPLVLASAEGGVAPDRPWAGARIDTQPEAPSAIEAALAEALGMPAPEDDGADVLKAAAVIEPDGSVGRSPRPTDRPSAGSAGAEAEPVVMPVPVAEGTWLADLGAFASEAEARDAWARLAAAPGGALGDWAPLIQPSRGAEGDLWRLVASGFEGEAGAERLCVEVAAQGATCAAARAP